MSYSTFYSRYPVLVVFLISSALHAGADSEEASSIKSESGAFALPTDLTATLTAPGDSGLRSIDLQWKNHATEPFGCLVEVAFNDETRFVILGDTGSDSTQFRHPDLSPATTFHYRVRPFYGPVSNIAEVTTQAAPEEEPVHSVGPLETKEPASSGAKASVRTSATLAAAAPTNLTAELNYPTSALLKWKDCASDEEGYAVEMAVGASAPFRALAMLPPDTTTYQMPPLPEKSACRFRVRAFFYGQPSNLASLATPDEPRTDLAPQETEPAEAAKEKITR